MFGTVSELAWFVGISIVGVVLYTVSDSLCGKGVVDISTESHCWMIGEGEGIIYLFVQEVNLNVVGLK